MSSCMRVCQGDITLKACYQPSPVCMYFARAHTIFLYVYYNIRASNFNLYAISALKSTGEMLIFSSAFQIKSQFTCMPATAAGEEERKESSRRAPRAWREEEGNGLAPLSQRHLATNSQSRMI